jgi:P-type conjugative transfer protein TrbJ
MNRCYKALPLVISATIIVLLWSPAQTVAAEAVFCTNCGTEYTQLFNKLQMLKQVETGIQQLQTQINQYQDMMSNSQGFSSQVWGNAFRDIGKLNALIQQSKALAYSASNLDSQFSKRYGDYKTYQTRKMNGSDWDQKYDQWSRETSDNALYTLKAVGLQSSQMQDEDTLIQQLQAMSQSAQGRMQAIQVGNMMAAQNINQIQKLRQLMMLQLQMQANYIAAQQDKVAAEQAARKQYFHRIDVSTRDGKRY